MLRPIQLVCALVALLVAFLLLPGRASGQSVSTAAPPATIAAIRKVIQQANQEQQQAFSQNNPVLMQDTATPAYYAQLARTLQQLKSSGVTAIQLLGIEWGPVRLIAPDQAKAITAETWQTSFADGSLVQSTDPNIYTLVNEDGAWRIAADVHPGSAIQIPVPSTVPQPSPVPFGRHTSLNWSGYEATGGTFTAVSGTWTVPQPSDATPGADAAWVGIGGVTTRDLIQAGTEATVSGPGQVSYDAWIEMLPRPSQPVNLAVHPGDSISVSISLQAPDQWLISMKNNVTGQSYRQTVAYRSTGSSAEWVEEAPSGRGGILPLDGFGHVNFSGGMAVKDGKQLTIAQAGGEPITMVNQAGQPLAIPSELGQDGASFSISRSSAPASPDRGLVPLPVGPVMPRWPPFPVGMAGWPGRAWTSPDGSISAVTGGA